jgi:hypothetical protein
MVNAIRSAKVLDLDKERSSYFIDIQAVLLDFKATRFTKAKKFSTMLVGSLSHGIMFTFSM